MFLVLYVFYCVGMAFNSHIEKWANEKLPVPQSWRDAQQAGIQGQDTNYKTIHKGQNGAGGIPMQNVDPESNFDDPAKMQPEDGDIIKKPQENDPFTRPTNSILGVVKFYIMLPLYYLARFTIPDCRKEAWANAYILTFLFAIVWISIYSYMMVWMITVVGFTFGIPDTVMGLTFIAAGVSVPDALSGIAVVKEGTIYYSTEIGN
jgi:sodium/potassium/calcium exchanger 4